MNVIKNNFTGVWIDMKKAVIISILDDSTNVRTILSDIETRERFAGETSQAGRFGGQAVEPERTKAQRIEHEIKDFLKSVTETLSYTSPVVLFGPADMKKKLYKELLQHAVLKNNVKGVEIADSMTENQMVAWVKDYFSLK